MNRKKHLHLIAESYKEEESKTKTGDNIEWKILKRILRRVITILSIKFIFLLIIILVLFLPIIIFLLIFSSIFWWNESSWWLWNNSSHLESFWWNFSNENLDTPLWIPVEKWILTYWYDYTLNKSPLISDFIKITYSNAHEFYEWHKWIDFWMSYKDKQSWSNPIVLSTLRWVIKQVDTREEIWSEYKYTRKTYRNWNFIENSQLIKKSKEKTLRPYWNNVILSSIDWNFYVIYAHLNDVNKQVIEKWNVSRGQIIWVMWTTWNSTWVHLHYEIRYCWSNKSLNKNWHDCTSVNPLWFLDKNKEVFLGFSKLPSINQFIAWTFEKLKKYLIPEDDVFSDINKEYTTFCNTYKLILLKRDFECKELFPIIYTSKDNSLFPMIKDETEWETLWWQYVREEYSIEWVPTLEQLKEIAKIEGINKKLYTSKELYSELSNKLSYWKYLNKNKVYQISNTKELKEEDLIIDLFDTLDELKKTNKNSEKLFNKYYLNDFYSELENPYVYNMIDKNKIFLWIYDTQWNFISRYNKYWVFTIFKNLN